MSRLSLVNAQEKLARAILDAQTVAREARLDPPIDPTPVRRFGYGVGLPLAVLRVAFRDRALRRRYLKIFALQTAVTLFVTFAIAFSNREARALLQGGARDLTIHGVQVHLNHVPTMHATLAFWSALLATFYAIEWCVLAVSREYQKMLTRDVSLACGIAPDDEAITPRLRVNFKWLREKLRQKLRGAFVFGSIFPIAWLVGHLPVVGDYLQAVAIAIWGAYWAGVFTASKTAQAWKDEASAPEPIYLRALDEAIATTRVLDWWGPRTMSRLWRKFTKSMFSPAHQLELSPYELSGLSLSRTLRSIPVLSLFLRPLFSIAASHVVVQRRRELGLETVSETRTEALAMRIEAPPLVASSEHAAEIEAVAEIEASADVEPARRYAGE